MAKFNMYDETRYHVEAVTDFMKEVEKKKTVFTNMTDLSARFLDKLDRLHFNKSYVSN